MYNKTVFLLILHIFVVITNGQFIYNYGGVFRFNVGLAFPTDVNIPSGSLVYFTNAQVFYGLPDNITYFEPHRVMNKRSIRNTMNRLVLYQAFDKYFKRFGVFGKECLQQFICRVARSSRSNTLIGRIMKIIFSPLQDLHLDQEYKNAHWHGIYNSTYCEKIFRNCSGFYF